MPRVLHSGFLFLMLAGLVHSAQDDEKLKSGPKEGTFIPAPFACYNVNGEAKGRMRCLICDFALSPAIMVFVKEPAEGKDKSLDDLLTQLEEAAQEFSDRHFSAGVVFLSPDARDSTNSVEDKSAKIIEEASLREKLVKRIEQRVEKLKLKHVIAATYLPAGPKGYELNPKADCTVLFYEKLKVIKNWSFSADQLQDDKVAEIIKLVREKVPTKKNAKAPQN